MLLTKIDRTIRESRHSKVRSNNARLCVGTIIAIMEQLRTYGAS